MSAPYVAALAFVVLSTVIVLSLVVGARLLRVRARVDAPLKQRPYECGEEPLGPTWIRFHPRYYVVALFFVLFDLEAAFLMPWALVVRRAGAAGLAAITGFVVVLMLGWLYAVRKEALKWQ